MPYADLMDMRPVVPALALTLVAGLLTAVPGEASERITTAVTFESPVRATAYLGYSNPPMPVVGYSVGFRAMLTAEQGARLADRKITFWQADVVGRPQLLCTGTTNAYGVARCERYTDGPRSFPVSVPWLPRRTDKVYAEFTGDRMHQGSSAEARWVTVSV